MIISVQYPKRLVMPLLIFLFSLSLSLSELSSLSHLSLLSSFFLWSSRLSLRFLFSLSSLISLSSSNPLTSLSYFYFLSLLFSLLLSPSQSITFDSLVSLSSSLWWHHGSGFCSWSVLVWIDDRGFGFFVWVLEFYGIWFGSLVLGLLWGG